jgi:hypothetical protein
MLYSWLQKFDCLRGEFLLPLPLLLIAFGIGGEPLTNLLLSHPYGTPDKLLADTHTVKVNLALNMLVTEAVIEQEQDYTKVKLKIANSGLKKLEYEFPATKLSSVEGAIAQELGLSPKVKPLQPNRQIQSQLAVNVQGILATINKQQGITKVEVKTANSVLKKLEFEFTVTELSQVKAAIAQQLRLSPENLRLLVSYRIKN